MNTFTKWLLGGTGVAAALTAIANFWDIEGGEQGGTSEYLITLLILAVTTAIVFLIGRSIVGSARNVAVAGVVFGVLSVLAVPVFWLGLPAVFGGAAIGLGLATSQEPAGAAGSERAARRPAVANVAIGLGALGILVFVLSAIFG